MFSSNVIYYSSLDDEYDYRHLENDINPVVKYQGEIAYIYPNVIGKKLLDYWHLE